MDEKIERYVCEYSADLTRLCMALCGNRYDAEDLFQDTWKRAIQHFDQFHEDTDFEKWLYKICVNLHRNALKSVWRRRRHDFRTAEEADLFFSAIPDADDRNREDYAELHDAVTKLPQKQRTVIVLYYFKDLSIREIAGIVGTSEGTVKSRLYQARTNLKRRLYHE